MTRLRFLREPLMRRAGEFLRASLGEEHPNTVGVTENYRLLREAMGKVDDR